MTPGVGLTHPLSFSGGKGSLMIYSRFGTVLTLVSKTESESGKVSVQATTEGSADLHEYHVGDLTADDGSPAPS